MGCPASAAVGAGEKHNSGINENEGTIIINGGNIRAKGQDGASAIGGMRRQITLPGHMSSESRQCGSITINGGIVRTEAVTRHATPSNIGIGSCPFGYGGSVTINGGTVMANATADAICYGARRQHHHQRRRYNGTRRHSAKYGRRKWDWDLHDVIADITINGGNIDAYSDRNGCRYRLVVRRQR